MNLQDIERPAPSPATLLHQAGVARRSRRRQLAANLERAAELVEVPDAAILEIYNALRPHRSTAAELAALADRLRRGFHAPQCARWVEEAAAAYQRHGLLRP